MQEKEVVLNKTIEKHKQSEKELSEKLEKTEKDLLSKEKELLKVQ